MLYMDLLTGFSQECYVIVLLSSLFSDKKIQGSENM